MIDSVPVFIFLRAAQAEISRKVYDALAGIKAAHRLLRRGAVRQREEGRGGGERSRVLRRNKGKVVIYMAQMRMDRADRRAGFIRR